MRWPFDKRLDAAHAWGIFGGGLAVLLALPALLAIEHTKGPFLVWWPTDWMAAPLGVCVAGLVLLFLPVRRSVAVPGPDPVVPIPAREQAVAAQSAPGQPSPLPPAPAADDLVDLLGAIPEMDEPAFRARVYAGVPRPVMQQVRHSEKSRLDLLSVTETFETYAHLHPWPALLRQLKNNLPENPHVARLEARLRELGLAEENAAP